MKVLAIDPGERVGWAVGELVTDLAVRNHGITALKPFALKLHEVAGEYDVIIYETYRVSANEAKLRSHTGSDVPTLQLIGMIRLAAWLNPRVKLVGQGPGTKKTADRTMPDWLRETISGLPTAHDDSHDGDALRHLWFWHFKHNI